MNNLIYSVIGVLPEGFHFPDDADIWFPADISGKKSGRCAHNYWGVGRLKDGVNTSNRRATDIGAIARRIYQESAEKTALLRDGRVVPLQEFAITGSSAIGCC